MKRLVTLILIVSFLISLAACANTATTAQATTKASISTTAAATTAAATTAGSTTVAKNKVPKIGMAVFDYANTFMSYVRKGIQNYCADGKATLEVVDAANDQTKQNEQVTTLLAKGIDILLLNLVDPGAGDTILKLAKAKNVPVVFFNRAPNMEILSNWEKCWYVGISWRAPGLVQSTLVLADWKANKAKMDKNGDGILQYALIQGNVSQQDAIHRTAAIKDTFAEYNKSGEMKNELLDLQVADWNTTKAKELMDVWNVKYGNKIEAVVSNNDAMALGAIESMKAAGVFTTPGKYVYVYGINCLPEVAQLLKSGELSGTVLTSPWMQAVACVDIAVNVFNGKEPLAGTTFKFDTNKDVRVVDIAITKANMADGVSAYEKCK